MIDEFFLCYICKQKIKRWVCELSPKSWTSKKGPEAVHEEASDKWHRRSAGVILFKFHR